MKDGFLYGRCLPSEMISLPFVFTVHSLSVRSVCCLVVLGLLCARCGTTGVVANAALVTKLALAFTVVFVSEAAALLELAVALEVEAAQSVALPLALSLEGTTNEGLLSASAHAEGSSTTAVALLHVRVHALLLVAVVASTSAEAARVTLEASHTAAATTGDHALALGGECVPVETRTGVVVLLVHGVGTVDLLLLHDELQTNT